MPSSAPTDAGHATVENWNDADMHLEVRQPHGYFCNLSMLARVPLPPDQVFSILTDPDNARIFKCIKAVRNRRVVWREGDRQLVEVEQLGQWRFLWFHGTFVTKLRVEEDRRSHSIRFELSQPGWMKKFQGSWRIEPFTQSSLDDLVNGAQRAQRVQHATPRGGLQQLQASLGSLQERLNGRQAEASLVRLEQSVLPAFVPPPPADRLVKRIAAKQLVTIMSQLRQEADRLNSCRDEEKAAERSSSPKTLAAHVRKL